MHKCACREQRTMVDGQQILDASGSFRDFHPWPFVHDCVYPYLFTGKAGEHIEDFELPENFRLQKLGIVQ